MVIRGLGTVVGSGDVLPYLVFNSSSLCRVHRVHLARHPEEKNLLKGLKRAYFHGNDIVSGLHNTVEYRLR